MKKFNFWYLIIALINFVSVILWASSNKEATVWNMFLFLFAGTMMCTAALMAGYVGFVKVRN